MNIIFYSVVIRRYEYEPVFVKHGTVISRFRSSEGVMLALSSMVTKKKCISSMGVDLSSIVTAKKISTDLADWLEDSKEIIPAYFFFHQSNIIQAIILSDYATEANSHATEGQHNPLVL